MKRLAGIATLALLTGFVAAGPHARAASTGAPPYLRTMHAPATLRALCRRIRSVAGKQHIPYVVVCPTIVPWSPSPATQFSGVLDYRNLRGGYLINGMNPPQRGQPAPVGHWSFATGPARDIDGLLNTRAADGSLQAPHTVTHGHIGSRKVLIYQVQADVTSFYAGHVVIVWRNGAQEYQVSVHRWRSTHQATLQAMTMARSLIQPSPAKRN